MIIAIMTALLMLVATVGAAPSADSISEITDTSLSPMGRAILRAAYDTHVQRAEDYGFSAMSVRSMHEALSYILPSTFKSEATRMELPPSTILHAWNPGARCAPKSELVGQVDPVCIEATSDYDMVYMDDLTPLRVQLLNGATAALFVAGGAECSFASAWGVCPALMSPCQPDVPVPGTAETVALNVPTCRHLCEEILNNCIGEMINIFGFDNQTAHEILRCAPPQGNVGFYGATSVDIFPAAPDPGINNTVLQPVNVTLVVQGPNGTLEEEVHEFEQAQECYDGSIGRIVNLAVLNCPSGLVSDNSGEFCRFECPEPLVSSSEYEALKALVTLGACLSVAALIPAICIYCTVPVLRRHPNGLAVPLFISLLGIALSLLLGAVDGYHEGTWCSDSGNPNEWGSGTCTVQGIGIVYFSYSSALWWLMILLHLALTRGFPTFRRPKNALSTSPTDFVRVPMQFQRRYLSVRIPFEWLFVWAKRYRVLDKNELNSVADTHDSDSDDTTSSDSSSVGSSSSGSQKRGNRNSKIAEWPMLPKWLKRRLRLGVVGLRIYGYTALAHLISWGVPVVPVVIGLAAKQIGYGGADLWCTVHSGADISYRVTEGGVEHNRKNTTNPWLLGLYIAPIFAILIVGSILASVVVLSGCGTMGYILTKYRAKGLRHNMWGFVAEWSRQIRLIAFAAAFLVVYVLQLLWLSYFSAVRPRQYDLFADFVFCSFVEQTPVVGGVAPGSCSLKRIVNVGFWGFTALVFAAIGVPVAVIFLSRPEPIRWAWHLLRHGRPLLTIHSWERYVKGVDHTTSIDSDGISHTVSGRKLTKGEITSRGMQSYDSGRGGDGGGALGGGGGNFVAVRKSRKKVALNKLNLRGVASATRKQELSTPDADISNSDDSSEDSEDDYDSGTESESDQTTIDTYDSTNMAGSSPKDGGKSRAMGRSESQLMSRDGIGLTIEDDRDDDDDATIDDSDD